MKLDREHLKSALIALAIGLVIGYLLSFNHMIILLVLFIVELGIVIL